MSTISKKPKVGSGEGQFQCSICRNSLELEDTLLLLGKIFSSRVRHSDHLLNLMKKCPRYDGLKIGCLHACCVKVWKLE